MNRTILALFLLLPFSTSVAAEEVAPVTPPEAPNVIVGTQNSDIDIVPLLAAAAALAAAFALSGGSDGTSGTNGTN